MVIMPLSKDPQAYTDDQIQNFGTKDLSDIISTNSKNTEEVITYKLKVLRRSKNGLDTIPEESELKHSNTIYKDTSNKSKV